MDDIRLRRLVLLLGAAVLLGATVLLSACGSGELRWRDLTVALPDGWVVHEQADTRLSLTDAPLGSEAEPGLGEAGAFFTHEVRPSGQDWRDLAEQHGWRIEVDERIEVGGAPATRLVYVVEAPAPLREMVVVVPARHLVILMQPIVYRGSTAGPAVFDQHREAFESLLAGIRFVAPPEAFLRGRRLASANVDG